MGMEVLARPSVSGVRIKTVASSREKKIVSIGRNSKQQYTASTGLFKDRSLRFLRGCKRLPISGSAHTSRVVCAQVTKSAEEVISEAPTNGAVADLDVDLEEEYSSWTNEDAASLYRVEGWGSPYFSVNSKGNVAVRPTGSEDGSDELDLLGLIEALRKRKVAMPLIIRFPDIVQHRMQQMQECFDNAIAKFNYQGHFQGVFPVKCNHDRYLVEDIVEYGRQHRFGLEAGSKPELLIAIANLRDNDDALLICNGYKDAVYMESVLLARQLGTNAIIVLEQMEELPLLIEVSRRLNVRPVIGIRAKLSTKHSGHWGETSGDKGKFGLTVPEMVRVVYTLRKEGMLDCLQLLHFHIGSQVASISIIKEAMREASHMYCELALMGAPMGHIDVGGGLGIDYDGTKSTHNSTNYTMQNYARDVVAALLDACVVKGVKQPIITSESGRALASHHSVLIFDVLNSSDYTEEDARRNLAILKENQAKGLGYSAVNLERMESSGVGSSLRRNRTSSAAGDYLLSTFVEVFETIDESNYQEAFNDAKQFKQEAGALFKLGCLSLEQRAQAESLYVAVCHRVLAFAKENPDMPEELSALSKSLSSVYHINLSIFQSAVDTWAIGQLFPIMPLHRLNEEPTVQCTLADLTCDSDGKITQFIGPGNTPSNVLPVHKLKEGEPYYLGMFLGGVYQETMGSLHNMFGGLNTVHVRTKTKAQSSGKANGNVPYVIEHVVRGQTMAEVLRTVQHEGEDMMEALRCEAEDAVHDGRLTLEESSTLLSNFHQSLNSYTYLT